MKEEIKGKALQNAFNTFILSRQAMRCTPATIEFYQNMIHPFIIWAEQHKRVSKPRQINSNLVRAFLADLGCRTKSDWTVNDHARAIRTLLRFWYSEKIVSHPVTFQMPKVHKKKMPVLSMNELQQLISACGTQREKALVLFLADSGLRRAEVIALNWSDLNLENGSCCVKLGKGEKSRTAVIGPCTRQALAEYRKTLTSAKSQDPLIQSIRGTRFTDSGLLQVFLRLSKRAGMHVTPHTLRRTFVKLSLRSKMNPLHLKDLLGHESLNMVMYYAGQFDEDELLEAHREHSPIENLMKINKSVEPDRKDPKDGDPGSAPASAGMGTDEDYGDFGPNEGC
jgi:integrase/recombinase XerD